MLIKLKFCIASAMNTKKIVLSLWLYFQWCNKLVSLFFLYSLYTYDCIPLYNANAIIRFADDMSGGAH